ncbi:MAG: VanZ family protein [Candidatus Izimaplasma sp.]|nr:VanZ family protein [Candidatus Izimaplasma bacterium]
MNYKKNISWILVIGWMAIIFLLSAQGANDSAVVSAGITDRIYQVLNSSFPNLNIETLHIFIRKLAHFAIYLVLGGLVFNALNYNEQKQSYNFIVALLISFLYAISDEIHQTFVPGRAGQIYDVLIDLIGSLIGIKALVMYNNFYKKKER